MNIAKSEISAQTLLKLLKPTNFESECVIHTRHTNFGNTDLGLMLLAFIEETGFQRF